ncbi:MAG TPA: glycosyltransferase family 2 protein [Candidatus Dormibacteraeota bacterium]
MAAPASAPLTSVIIVTYQPDPGLLQECLASLVASTHRPIQVVVVDNGSAPGSVRSLVERDLPTPGISVEVAAQATNLGYAAATNIGIRACQGEFVLMLNPDARVEPDTIRILIAAAARHPEAAGLAPKILLSAPQFILDSVGMSMHAGGAAAQRGLGQIDIGQYDVEEPVDGLCFAAAFVRSTAFARSRVGTLDRRYFMFYEDVDWSLRAQVLGETFWSVPSARVIHFHSATTRHLGGDFKTRLIQRNLIWTAAKNLEARSATKVLIRRTAVNLKHAAELRYPAASLRAVLEAWTGLPRLMKSRRQVQRRRRRRDVEVVSTEQDRLFFDVATYRPEISVAALLSALSRLYIVSPAPGLEQVVNRIQVATVSGAARDPVAVAAMVRQGQIAISPALDWLLQQMEAGPRN